MPLSGLETTISSLFLQINSLKLYYQNAKIWIPDKAILYHTPKEIYYVNYRDLQNSMEIFSMTGLDFNINIILNEYFLNLSIYAVNKSFWIESKDYILLNQFRSIIITIFFLNSFSQYYSLFTWNYTNI